MDIFLLGHLTVSWRLSESLQLPAVFLLLLLFLSIYARRTQRDSLPHKNPFTPVASCPSPYSFNLTHRKQCKSSNTGPLESPLTKLTSTVGTEGFLSRSPQYRVSQWIYRYPKSSPGLTLLGTCPLVPLTTPWQGRVILRPQIQFTSFSIEWFCQDSWVCTSARPHSLTYILPLCAGLLFSCGLECLSSDLAIFFLINSFIMTSIFRNSVIEILLIHSKHEKNTHTT